jgi:hypothetical protein
MHEHGQKDRGLAHDQGVVPLIVRDWIFFVHQPRRLLAQKEVACGYENETERWVKHRNGRSTIAHINNNNNLVLCCGWHQGGHVIIGRVF